MKNQTYQEFKKIKAKELVITSKLGFKIAKNIEVEVFDKNLSSLNFNPQKHDYLVASDVIQKYGLLIAREFYEEVVFGVLLQKRKLTADEVSGIRIALGVDGSQLAVLLGVNKGTISKILSGKIQIKTPESIILMTYLKRKLDHPNEEFSQLVDRLKSEDSKALKILTA